MIQKATSYDVSGVAIPPRYAMTQFTVDEFFEFWPKLEKILDRVPHTWRHWTKEYICTSVAIDRTQVWGIGPPPKAVLVLFTTICVHPAMKVLSIAWAAGTFEDEMLPLLDATLTGYARLNECQEIEIRGRMGWEPKLKAVGFERVASMWTRPVLSVKLN